MIGAPIAPRAILVMPMLWDAWLEENPPCPTCGGKGRVLNPNPLTVDGVAVPCPDCADGVLPFDKWTAGLVARIEQLERWKAEQLLVYDLWEDAWERVQPLGVIGQYKSVIMADEILRLRREVKRLRREGGDR